MPNEGATGPIKFESLNSGAPCALTYRLAQTCEEVVEAWRMLYRTYLQANLINPNRHAIHIVPQATEPGNAVIFGTIGQVLVTTLTAFVDSPQTKLPLDRVYRPQLDNLREQGRHLMEVGLFADRRDGIARSAPALFQLMRYAYYFGLQSQVTDFVIGVHPRHARFYIRSFGFDQFGDPTHYPTVNNRLVVLLRGDLEARLATRPLDPALQFFKNHPVPDEAFAHRFAFGPQDIAGSPIEAYLRDYESHQDLSQTG